MLTSTATASGGGDVEASEHKCFMCGSGCPSEAALDQHVILCAKGQLKRRGDVIIEAMTLGAADASLSDVSQAAAAGPDIDVSAHATAIEDGSRDPPADGPPPMDATPSHDVSLDQLPSAVLTSRSLDASMPSGGSTPPLDHSNDAGRALLRSPSGEEGGTAGSSSMSPKPPRRRRAHTAHEDPEDVAERNNRRCLMEEQLLSLESMQLANQERLRRSATATTPLGEPLASADTPPLSTSSQAARTNSGVGMRSGIASLKSPSSGSFSRHHSNVLWSDRQAGETSPLLSPSKLPAGRGVAAPPVLSLRGSLERSSSAMVLPSNEGTSRQASVRHTDPSLMHDTAPSPAAATATKRPPMRHGTGAQRTLSSDARRSTASPQAPSRRSSTVASRKAQQQNNNRNTANGASSLNSSVELPRSEPPAPVPRAATTVRQRAAHANASRLASLMPQRSAATTGKHMTSSDATTPTASAARGPTASANTSGVGVQSAVRAGGSNASGRTATGGSAGPSAVPWSSTFSNKSAVARRAGESSIGGTVPAATGSAAASLQKSKPSHPPAGAFHLTTSAGSVVVGGHVPPPRHSTLRPPNPSKKGPTASHAAVPSVGAAPGAVRHSAALPPPPPVRQSSLSMTRSSLTPDRAVSLSSMLAASPPGAGAGAVEAKAVYCAECGMKYVDKAKFCAFCGHRREAFATA